MQKTKIEVFINRRGEGDNPLSLSGDYEDFICLLNVLEDAGDQGSRVEWIIKRLRYLIDIGQASRED